MASSPAAQAPLSRLTRSVTRTVEIAFTTTIAWAFGLGTAAVLLYLARGLWNGEYGQATPLTLTHPTHSAQPWGLTFLGISGAYAAAGMAAGILIALGMSMMVAGTPRRLGLLAALFWAGLWAANAILLVAQGWNGASWSGPMEFIAAALALCIIVACMFHRMIRLWRIRVTA